VDITAALLCDAATVREGLLHVLGGGITRLLRAQYPAPLGLTLALVLELTPGESGRLHDLEIAVIDSDGHRMAGFTAGFQSNPKAELVPGEPIAVALTFNLNNVVLPQSGGYSAEILIDGRSDRSLSFQALEQQLQAMPSPEGPLA
jgi:hypothetical protein